MAWDILKPIDRFRLRDAKRLRLRLLNIAHQLETLRDNPARRAAVAGARVVAAMHGQSRRVLDMAPHGLESPRSPIDPVLANHSFDEIDATLRRQIDDPDRYPSKHMKLGFFCLIIAGVAFTLALIPCSVL